MEATMPYSWPQPFGKSKKNPLLSWTGLES
jgi:hypothetical protein